MPTESSATIDQNAKNFLTESEMKKFLAAARQSRHGVRNFCLLLTAYRHACPIFLDYLEAYCAARRI
jgi:hypothetical protein